MRGLTVPAGAGHHGVDGRGGFSRAPPPHPRRPPAIRPRKRGYLQLACGAFFGAGGGGRRIPATSGHGRAPTRRANVTTKRQRKRRQARRGTSRGQETTTAPPSGGRRVDPFDHRQARRGRGAWPGACRGTRSGSAPRTRRRGNLLIGYGPCIASTSRDWPLSY